MPDANFATFLKIFANPKSATSRSRAIGAASPARRSRTSSRKWQAGKVKDLQGGLAEVDKQIDAQLAAGQGRRRRAVSRRAGRRGEAPAPAPPAVDRRRARRRAAWRRRAAPSSLFLSPWIVGFSVFFGYPLVMTRVPLVQPLRPAHAAALGRARELPLPLRRRPADLAGGQEHALDHRRSSCRCRCCSRSASRVMLTRAQGAAPASSARSSTCRRSRRRSPRRSASSTSSTRRPGRSTRSSRRLGIEGPLWFNDPALVEAVARRCSASGAIGNTMIIFLAAVLDVPQHLYESAELDGAGALPAAALGDAADDQPGDPVRRRARRDPGAAVLHAGVRRGEHRRRARRRRPARRARSSSATRRARRCSIPSCSTSTGSASSTWATRRRWRCCCWSSRSR